MSTPEQNVDPPAESGEIKVSPSGDVVVGAPVAAAVAVPPEEDGE